jgi:serine phosphatase RsbU (regulator of sigma subunit)
VRVCVALTQGVLDTDGVAWRFDEVQFISLPTPDSIGAPLGEILAKLSDNARDVLSSAALLGQRFDARWLSSMGHLEGDVDRALWIGIQLRLLASSDGRHLSFVRTDAVAVLGESVSDDLRRARFATLARSLALSHSATRAERALLARACFLTADATTAGYAYNLCLDAGLQALDGFVFGEALSLLRQALALTERYDLPADFRLHRGFAQLEAQTGAVDQAVTSFVAAIASCPDAHARAAMHLRCAELRFFHDAIASRMREHLAQAWREFGRQMPQSTPWSWLIGLWFALVVFFVERTGHKSGVDGTDPAARTRVRLCEQTALYYFFTDQLPATFGCAMYGWYLGRRLAPCRELAAGLASIGNMFYTAGLIRLGDRYYAETYALVDHLQDRAAFANTRYLQGVGLSFGGELQRGELILAQTLDQYAGDLDVAYLATGSANLTSSYLTRGYVHKAAQVYTRLREHLRARLGTDAPLPEMCVGSQIDLLIQTNDLSACEQPVARLSRGLTSPEQDPLLWVGWWHVLATWEQARGADHRVVVAALDQASRSALRPEGVTWLTARGWVAAAYMELSLYRRAHAALKTTQKHRLFLAIERARRAVRSPYLRGHAHVLTAIRYWLQGKGDRAERELVKAEREARLRDLPSVLIETHALRASILLDAGHDQAAHHEGRCAMAVALGCGQQRRAMELERELAVSITVDASGSRSIDQSSRDFAREHSAQRERDVLLQVAAVASGEIDPAQQARAILDRLLSLFGAERGMIFADGSHGKLERLAGRTAQHTDLDRDVVYAQSLVRRVRDSGAALVVNGTEEGAALGSQSVLAASLRSIVCTPIRLGAQTRGVLYLDSSLAKGVFTRDDLDLLAAMGGYIALTQEMARAASVEIERRALDADLQLSGAVQSLLLPQQADLKVGELELSAAYAPASHSGGDWWAWEELEDGRVWLLVGDAAGHGAAAAMVTALLAGAHRNAVDSGVRDLEQLLHSLNLTVTALCRGRHTVNMLALEWSNTHELKVLSAAAPPLLKRHADGRIESVVVRGSGLGANPFAFGEASVLLEPGERIVVVSDGILEMRMEDGRELGIRRLRQMFAAHGNARASTLRDALMHDIDALRGATVVEDDLTLLVLSRH